MAKRVRQQRQLHHPLDARWDGQIGARRGMGLDVVLGLLALGA